MLEQAIYTYIQWITRFNCIVLQYNNCIVLQYNYYPSSKPHQNINLYAAPYTAFCKTHAEAKTD